MTVIFTQGKSLRYEKNPAINGANIKQAIGAPEGASMCIGCWRFDAGTSFDWTYDEGDELIYLTEGSLDIRSEGKTLSANPGDFVYFSKGTKASFSTENGVTGLYTGYPAAFIEDVVVKSEEW